MLPGQGNGYAAAMAGMYAGQGYAAAHQAGVPGAGHYQMQYYAGAAGGGSPGDHAGMYAAAGYGGMYGNQQGPPGRGQEQEQEPEEREGLPYSRKPRPVDFQPYSQKDFEEKEYNVKKNRGYYELGRLGPDLESEELQSKVRAAGWLAGRLAGPRYL